MCRSRELHCLIMTLVPAREALCACYIPPPLPRKSKIILVLPAAFDALIKSRIVFWKLCTSGDSYDGILRTATSYDRLVKRMIVVVTAHTSYSEPLR